MLPAKPFYLIRHGETYANAKQITAGGEFDTPLTPNGRAQAQAMANLLHHLPEKPAKIIHSSMSRARDTASILNEKLNLQMHEDHDLREHMMGEWGGLPWDESAPLLLKDIKPEGGETCDEFAARIRRAITKILDEHDDLVMMVAHGGLFHALTHMHNHQVDISIHNCQLHLFEPHAEYEQFPWRVWQFDIIEDRLEQNTAPFCSTQIKLKKVS